MNGKMSMMRMMTLLTLVAISATVSAGLEQQQWAEIENEYCDDMVLENLHFVAGNCRQRRNERLAKISWNRRLSRWMSPRNRMKRFWTYWETLSTGQQKRLILVHRIKQKLPLILVLVSLAVIVPAGLAMIGLAGLTKDHDEMMAEVKAKQAEDARKHKLGLWMPDNASVMAALPTDILEHFTEMEDTTVHIDEGFHQVIIHSDTAVWAVTLDRTYSDEAKIRVTGVSIDMDLAVQISDSEYPNDASGRERNLRYHQVVPSARLSRYGNDPFKQAMKIAQDNYGTICDSESSRWRCGDYSDATISDKMQALTDMVNTATSIIDRTMTQEIDLKTYSETYSDCPVTWSWADWSKNGWEQSQNEILAQYASQLAHEINYLNNKTDDRQMKSINSHASILQWILDQHGVESFDELNANQVKLAMVAVQELQANNKVVPITADRPSQWASHTRQGAIDCYDERNVYEEDYNVGPREPVRIKILDPAKSETSISKYTDFDCVDDSIKESMGWKTVEDMQTDRQKSFEYQVKGESGHMTNGIYIVSEPEYETLDEDTFPAQLHHLCNLQGVRLQIDTTEDDKKGRWVLAPFRRPRSHRDADRDYLSADEDGGMLNTGWNNKQQFSHNRGDSKESKVWAFKRVLNYKTDTIGQARTSISQTVAQLIPVLMEVKDSGNQSPVSTGLDKALKALGDAGMASLGQSLFPDQYDAESNLVSDESGAVDIVSVFTLLFLPLVLVVKAIYKLQAYSSCGSREQEEEIYSSKTKVLYNFKMEARTKGVVVMSNGHFDGGSHPAMLGPDLKYWHSDEKETHAEKILEITTAYNEVRLKNVHNTSDFTENWSDSTYATGAGIKSISQAHNIYWAEVDGMCNGDYSEQQIWVYVLDSKTAFRKAVSQFSRMLDEGCPTVMMFDRMNRHNDHSMVKKAAKALRMNGQKDTDDERYLRSEELCAKVVKSAQKYIDLWQEDILYDISSPWTIWTVYESNFDDDNYGRGDCWSAAQIEASLDNALVQYKQSKQNMMQPAYMVGDEEGSVDIVSIMVLLFLPLILVVKMVQVMLTHAQVVEVLTSVRMKHHQDVQDDNSLLFDSDNMFAHLELVKVLEQAQKDSATPETMRAGCKCTDCQFLYIHLKNEGGDVGGQTMQERGLNTVMTAKIVADKIVYQDLCQMHDCDEPIGIDDKWFYLDNDKKVCEACFHAHKPTIVDAIAGSGKTALLKSIVQQPVIDDEKLMKELFPFSDNPDWETALDDMKEHQNLFTKFGEADLIQTWIKEVENDPETVLYDMIQHRDEMTYNNQYFVHCWIGLLAEGNWTAARVHNKLQQLQDLTYDESGAVDLVSIIMLILLPVIMVIKAVTYASDLVDKYSTHRHPAEAHRPDEDIPELLAFGGGVDSTAMVAIQCDRDAGFAVVNSILEAKGYDGWTSDQFDEMFPPVEHVVFADTGAEWDHTYVNIEYAKIRLQEAGIPFTIVHNEYRGPIDEYIKARGIVPFFNGGKHTCSKIWKQKPMQDWSREVYGKETTVRWAVGISYDETARMSKFNGLDKKAQTEGQISRFPMTDLMMTRYDEELIIKELDWSPNGEIVRLSACYHCPYNNEEDLRLLYNQYPQLWQKAVDIEQAFFDNTNHQAWLDAGKPLNGRCRNTTDAGTECGSKPVAGEDFCEGCGQEYNGVRRAPHGMWADDYANRDEDPQRLIQRNGPNGKLMSLPEWEAYITTGITPVDSNQARLPLLSGCGGCSSKDILFDEEASISIIGFYTLLFYLLTVPLIVVVKTVASMWPVQVNGSHAVKLGDTPSFDTCGGQSAPDEDGTVITLNYAVPSTNSDGFPHSAEQAKGLNILHDGFIHWAETGEPVCQIIEAVAGSGKTTYIKSVAKLMANLGLGSYRVILTAFNRHIAADLNQVAIDIGPSLSGFVKMGGSNTVQAAGLSEIIAPAGRQRGVDISVDKTKERNLARVVLADALGQYAEYDNLLELGTTDQDGNWISAWYAHANALEDFVSTVKDDGLDPRLDSFNDDVAALIKSKHTILNWNENPLANIPKMSILIQMVRRCITEGQALVFDARKSIMPASGAKSPNGKRGYQRGKYTFSGSSNDKTTAIAVKAIVPEPSTGGNKRKVTSNDAKRSGCKGTTKSMIEGGPAFDIKRINMVRNDAPATLEEYNTCEVNLPMFVRFSSYDAGNGNVKSDILKLCNAHVESTYQRNGSTSVRAAIGNFAKVGNNGNMQKANIGGIHRWKITDETAARNAMKLLALHFGTGAKGVYVQDTVDEEKAENPIGIVSFADMTYTPFYYDLKPPAPAVLLCVDEVQDLSVLKGDMVRRFADETTNVLLVGDRRQALYLFAGADGAAMTKNGESFNCEPLPMTICWRNSVKVGENVHRMMRWAVSETQSGEEPVDLSRTEVPAYADHRCPPVADWREGASSIRMPAHLVSEYIDVGDITCSRVVSPLARIAINTLRAGKPVVLPAGNDGIDGIVKRHWTGARPRGRAKMVKGLGLPATDSPKAREIAHDAPSQVSMRDIRVRIDDLLTYKRNKIIKDAGNDPKAVDKDDEYQNLVDETDCVLALAEGWLEQTGNMNESSRGVTYRADPALFLKWLDQFLGQTEGRNGEDSIRFASVHRVKGAQGKRTFVVMDRILKDKEGNENVKGAFMLPHCMTTPEEAVQELNAVYVAATRAIDQTILVSHDKELAELFPTKESFDIVMKAARSGDDMLVAMAYKNATLPEGERIEVESEVDHIIKCGSCDIELDADADVDVCVIEGCDAVMCKEYSGKEGSGPYGCGVPASFDDMLEGTGNKICLPCANEQREKALAKEAEPEEDIDFDKALEGVSFELPSGESSMQEKIDSALEDDESGAVDIFSIFMLLALPIVLLVNMAKKIIPAYTVAQRDALKEEGPNADKPSYYLSDDDTENQVINDHTAFHQKAGFFLSCEACGHVEFHNFTDSEKYPRQAQQLKYRSNPFSRTRSWNLKCNSCGATGKHHKCPKPPEWSPKSLKTVEEMGTRPEQWGFAPVKFHSQRIEEFWKCEYTPINKYYGSNEKKGLLADDEAMKVFYPFDEDDLVKVQHKRYGRGSNNDHHQTISAVRTWIIDNRPNRMPTTWKRNYKTYEVMDDIQSCMGSGEVVLAIHAGNEEYLWRKMHPMCEDTGYSCDVMQKYIPQAERDHDGNAYRRDVRDKYNAKINATLDRATLYQHYANHENVVDHEVARLRIWKGHDIGHVYDTALILYIKCPKCQAGKTDGMVRLKVRQEMTGRKVGFTAKVGTTGEWKKKPVTIGKVMWPKNNEGDLITKFDSRFVHHDCMVCGKPHIKSGLVPVIAKDDEEEWHGMWVGQDCAKKFMGFMRFTIPADSCKICNATGHKMLVKEVFPTPSQIEEEDLGKTDIAERRDVIWDCIKCGNSGTHDQMVIEYDMETSAGTDHVTVNAKDVGDKIRWEQLDGTIDFQPQERASLE